MSITQEVREKVRFLSPTYHRKGRHRRGLLTLHLLNEGLLDIGRPIVFPTDEKDFLDLHHITAIAHVLGIHIQTTRNLSFIIN